ncbi:MAG: AraC family transcriptional regulator [Actinomycetota bacterium]|nr:AraC family transcriptional regulator [Actinomycetota bacterium]
MSRRGHQRLRSAAAATASAAGEVEVEEYGYGLGPPTGMLVLRYPPQGPVVDFPESRNDFVHQVFWSPDGLLAVRRGVTTDFVGPQHALFVRRGVVSELGALDHQTVLRVCLRQMPKHLDVHAAARYTVTQDAADALLSVVRPGVSQETGLAARSIWLAGLTDAEPVAHRPSTSGPAPVVAAALLRNPADPTSLTAWAARLHVSPKTLQRDFEREYGRSFSAWRTAIRLQASTAMLSRWSVTETAHRVGYSSASAYIAAFTREYGEPPGRHSDRTTRGKAS